MNRNTDVVNMKITSNEGVNMQDNKQLKPGAKDSLGGTNTTEAWTPSASAKTAVKGPLGGMATK